jgi:LysM repeat protein
MATAVVSRPAAAGVSMGGKKALMSTIDGAIVFTLPFAPRDGQYSNYGQNWQEQTRVSNAPLLNSNGSLLPRISITLELWDGDTGTVDDQIATLVELSNADSAIRYSYGPSEAGLWRFTSLQINPIQRATSNGISEATAEIVMSRASDLSFSVGPVAGGVKPSTASKKSPKSGGKGTGSSAPRYVIFEKGDTLSSLAIKYYKNAALWRRIANAQTPPITNPNTIPVGKKLLIP